MWVQSSEWSAKYTPWININWRIIFIIIVVLFSENLLTIFTLIWTCVFLSVDVPNWITFEFLLIPHFSRRLLLLVSKLLNMWRILSSFDKAHWLVWTRIWISVGPHCFLASSSSRFIISERKILQTDKTLYRIFFQ